MNYRTVYVSAMRTILFSVLLLFVQFLNAQTPWTLVPSNFEHNGSLDAVVVLDGVEMTTGYLGAFVGDECRGIAEGDLFPVTGKTIFGLVCFSNESSGEYLSFRYYDPVADVEYPVNETIEFVANMTGNALDPYFLNAGSNSAPVANCPDQSTLAPAPGPITFDLCAIFSDPDGDELVYDAVYSDGSVNWTSSCELEFTTAATGTTTITLSASDGELEAECSYSFTVTAANQSPVVDQPVGMITLEEGFGSTVIDLGTVFSDPDEDVLTYSALSQDEGIVTTSVSGSSLTLNEVAPGNTTITITASDGELSVDDIASILVIAEVPAPPWSVTPSAYDYTGQLDAVVMVNGVEVASGVLAAFVGDDCRGIAEGAYFAPNGKTIFSLITNSNKSTGDLLTFRYYDPNNEVIHVIDEKIWFESDMVLGGALDPVLLNISTANNLPGVVNAISDQEVEEHFGTLDIDLSNVFTDPDGDNLTYIVSIDDDAVASVAISGTTLQITESGSGSTVVEVYASDGEFSMVDRFQLTVTPVNDPPEVAQSIADQLLQEGFSTENITISGTFSDPEGDVLSYSASSSDENVVTVRIEGVNLVITETGTGNAVVSVCVSDSEFEVCDQFDVIVEEVNESPVATCDTGLDEVIDEGFGSYTISNACDAFSDPDGDVLTFTVTSSDEGVATVAIDACTITVTEVGIGTTTISICASDAEFEVCCTFDVTVNFVNDAPEVVVPVTDQSFLEGFGTATISISETFMEPDGEALTYSASSGDEGIVTVGIDGTNLLITETGTGTSMVTVCASDGVFETCDQFEVFVEEVNNSPVVACPENMDTVLIEGFGSFNVGRICAAFSDPDDDPLAFSVSSSNTGVATVANDGCDITVTEAGLGQTTIGICASDGEFEVCCSFILEIVEENDLSVFLGEDLLTEEDSIQHCSDTVSFTLVVSSAIPWTIHSTGDWFTAEKTGDVNVEIEFSENTSGAARSGSITIQDTQEHVLNLVVYQWETCIPDAIEYFGADRVKVYPNPVNDRLFVSLEDDLSGTEITYALYDLRGRTIMTHVATVDASGTFGLNVHGLPAGMYILGVRTEVDGEMRIPVIKAAGL